MKYWNAQLGRVNLLRRLLLIWNSESVDLQRTPAYISALKIGLFIITIGWVAFILFSIKTTDALTLKFVLLTWKSGEVHSRTMNIDYTQPSKEKRITAGSCWQKTDKRKKWPKSDKSKRRTNTHKKTKYKYYFV